MRRVLTFGCAGTVLLTLVISGVSLWNAALTVNWPKPTARHLARFREAL